jgi:methyl-accepting chemotaxis protein
MKIPTPSVIWPLVLPVPLVLFLILAVLGFWLPDRIAENIRVDATKAARQTAEQFKLIRAYYTQFVIKKALESSTLRPMAKHKNEPDGIPLSPFVIPIPSRD